MIPLRSREGAYNEKDRCRKRPDIAGGNAKRRSAVEKSVVISYIKLSICWPYALATPLLGVHPQKGLHTEVHSSFIHYSWKVHLQEETIHEVLEQAKLQ